MQRSKYERSMPANAPSSGERNLHGRRLRPIYGLEMTGLLGMLRHGGGSFLVWSPLPYHTEGEEAAALIPSEDQLILGQSRAPPGTGDRPART